jgi:beta-glucosidase
VDCARSLSLALAVLALAWPGVLATTARASAPEDRARALVAQMTLDEKVGELHGIQSSDHRRFVPGVPRLGIPPLRITNGPAGVGPSDDPQQLPATALPAPISLAASFDRALARRHGELSGQETRDLAHSLLEAPDINIARVPVNGRTFEGYGEDPYLAGEIAVPNIEGIQSRGIIAEVKHYAANNQEANRFAVNEVIDDRTLHEIYLPHFEASVRDARAGSVMCAFPRINGTFACENGYLLGDVLRGQGGFDGFVQSDFGAAHSTVASALAGMDLEMPSPEFYGDEMKQAVEEGRIDERVVDTLLVRRYATMIRFGLFDRPLARSPIAVEEHGAFARAAAEQGAVLLKNAGGALPLDASKLDSIAVIGPYAGAAKTGGGGSSAVRPLYTVSPVDGIENRVGPDVVVRYARGVETGGPPAVPSSALSPPGQPSVHGLQGEYFANQDLSGTPALTRSDGNVDFNYGPEAPASGIPADHFSTRWTGTLNAPITGDYVLGLTSDDGSRLYVDGALAVDNWGNHSARTVTATVHLEAGPHTVRIEHYDNTGNASVTLGWIPPGAPDSALQEAVDAARASDVAVVMVGDDETEGRDRTSLALAGDQDRLVEAVSEANPRTIVVAKSGGPVLMPWLEDVPAVLEAWYPGQEDGSAVAALLFGDTSPSGKLPISFPKADGDVPARTPEQYPGVGGTAVYSEGLKVGYRWYDAEGIEPLFPFGFGLSYTTFAFRGLEIAPPDGTKEHFTVGADVTNTGRREGAEVAQVYVRFPAAAGEPPKQLKGFEKVSLRPGQTRHVTFRLDRRAFSTWDSAAQRWKVPGGRYEVLVGDSSRDLPLRATVTVRGDGS